MTEPHTALNAHLAAAYLNRAPYQSLDSSVPPAAPEPQTWTEDEVRAVFEDERAERAQAEAALEAEKQRLSQQTVQWQQYAQQLEQARDQLQSQLASHGQSAGEAAQRQQQVTQLQQQLQHAQAALRDAQVQAEQAQRLLAIEREKQLATALTVDDLDTKAATRKGVSALTYVLTLLVLIGAAAGAYYGVVIPKLQAAHQTAERTRELMRAETERLRVKLERQHARTAQDLAAKDQEILAAAKAARAAPSEHDVDEPSAVEARPASQAREARAKRVNRARAKRRARARRARARQAKARSVAHAQDPIAGLEGT